MPVSKTFKTVVTTTAVIAVSTLVYLNFFATSEKQLREKVQREYPTRDAQMSRSLGVLLGPPMLEGNRVEVLQNGDAIFASMLLAIRQAKKTITFETYIYWSETIGREFADALIERARAGVKVHILLDWIGSIKMEDRYLEEMLAAGIQIQRFHKPSWYNLQRMNNRTHRKVLVVDGAVGFTGGVGVADQWRGNARNPKEWRDTHVRIVGPVVAQMQAVFMDNWIKATGNVLHDGLYFPPLQSAGPMTAQMFSSSPSRGSDSMHLMYLMMIAAATHTIDLSASYFVPDTMAVEALTDAAKRGVKVRIITPGTEIDSEIVRKASRALWGPLLQAGVQIAEYQPTMFHCKVLVVDGMLVSVGSTNFDNRSFRLNDEANLNVLNADLAGQLLRDFEADWKQTKQYTFERWQARPWHEKALEQASALFRSQL